MNKVFLHTHIFIALCAAILTLGTQSILHIPNLPGAYYVLVGLGTLCVYNLHRSFGLMGVPRWNWPDRFAEFHQLRAINIFLSTVGIIVGIGLLYRYPEIWTWALLPPLVLVILYILPLRNGRTLRQVPFLKIFMIAMTWIWVTAILPLQITDTNLQFSHILVLTHRFLFVFAITIPFDIRDVYTDKQSDLKTLPSYYGVKSSKRWAVGILILSFAFLFFPVIWNSVSTFLIMGYLFIGIGSALLIAKSDPGKPDWYFGYLLDGSMLLLGAFETVDGLYF